MSFCEQDMCLVSKTLKSSDVKDLHYTSMTTQTMKKVGLFTLKSNPSLTCPKSLAVVKHIAKLSLPIKQLPAADDDVEFGNHLH